MELLKILVKELMLNLLQYNGNIAQNSLLHAHISDARIDAVATALHKAGYNFIYPTKTTKVRSHGMPKACDVYLYLEFENPDSDLTQVLTELDFKKTTGGMRYKL